MQAWPDAADGLTQLFGGAGLAAVAADPLLLCILQSVPVRDLALERVLTSLRARLLDASPSRRAAARAGDWRFAAPSREQCFINEYVFATTPEEDAKVDAAQARLARRHRVRRR